MNYWLEASIEYANQRNYLDNLFQVYPTIPEGLRDIDDDVWETVTVAFERGDDIRLLESLLRLELFPIKDSYVAYLKKDRDAIRRNPATVSRLCGRLYELGLNKIYENSSQPKETNRQIGPMFRNWVNKKTLGLLPTGIDRFMSTTENAILEASDAASMEFANRYLNYTQNKGLDFVARFNGKYIIGEAKFLTDIGGHQNAQFNDGVAIFGQQNLRAIPIAILDGVLYIKSKNKMHKDITSTLKDRHIMSALVLREFLYQV
ncbi:MAG: restriction endonuclease [Chloroflexi bacterium]|nr:restriction endonuclease [Chloroflexota bacterium]